MTEPLELEKPKKNLAFSKKLSSLTRSFAASRSGLKGEEIPTMVTIDKIACELFGFEGHENDEEMQTSLNYIENLFKPGDVITFKVEIRQQGGFKLKGFYSLVRFQT